MRPKPATADRRVAAIAERQHGVLSIAQLREAGLTDSAVKGRVRAGRLHRIHRGVYAPGHARLSHEGRWMAATLASGGVISHRSAAQLWRILRPAAGPVDVSVGGTGGRSRRSGIRLHRSRTLSRNDVCRRLGIPTTNPARTIADLHSVAEPTELRRAIRQAGVLGLRIDEAEQDRTRSELEFLFLRLCKREGLPTPEVNVPVGAFLVDFLWRERRLIVETDGYRYHGDRAAFEADRTRDLQLKSLGYEVIRLSYRQVVEEPDAVAAVLAPPVSGDPVSQ